MNYSLFITCPKGLEALLEEELANLGVKDVKQTVGGIYCHATLSLLYKSILWSRLANRVLLFLFSKDVDDKETIYQCCYEYDWQNLFSYEHSLSVNFHGQSEKIRNAMFGGLCVKDAIVDKFRHQTGQRPDINTVNAECKIAARLYHGRLSVYYDLSGHSLHQRGYRLCAGKAPLKENLAAALLYRSGWPAKLKSLQPLCDPCCGSGTLLIEAAMMATHKAPGLDRDDYGFIYWKEHNAALWHTIKSEATAKHYAALNNRVPTIIGYDQNGRILDDARKNIQKSGFAQYIHVEQKGFKEFTLPKEVNNTPGLIIANPPYGERLNPAIAVTQTESVANIDELQKVYQQLGLLLNKHCIGWQAAILTSTKALAQATGLRSTKSYAFYNGSIACKLYLFDLTNENKSSLTSISARAEMIFNRLKKNHKNLLSWRKQNNIHCYRVYDADMPEYAFAIDIYEDWAHIQEYAAPSEIPVEKTEKRIADVLQAVPLALEIPRHHVILKQRKKQKGKLQYERQAETQHKIIVHEGAAKFIVNCKDYIDTGLFLDHRLLRNKFFAIAKNKDFLNLFCYTATASVHAALGGAKSTTNVDMSTTYLHWGTENFKLNGIDLRTHDFIQTDCLQWLDHCQRQFDIIFLDAPSFSNSKRMHETLVIQRDYEMLITKAMQLLKPNGQLYFSTHFRKFKLNPAIFDHYQIEDITTKTIDKDFSRNPTIHKCYVLTKD